MNKVMGGVDVTRRRLLARSHAARFLLVPAFCLTCLVQPLVAGELDDFEGAATAADTIGSHSASGGGGSGWTGFLVEAGYFMFIYGGATSIARMRPEAVEGEAQTEGPPLKNRGEPVIPYLRLDAFYQDTDTAVQAIDGRIEVGWGPIGLQYRHTRYDEDRPDDTLDVSQWHVLYRMSFSRYFEVDMGFGSLTLSGNQKHSAFSFTLPIQIRTPWGVGAEFRPSWSTINDNSVDDYTLSAGYGIRFVSASLGYRWFKAGGMSLDGPFIGASFYF